MPVNIMEEDLLINQKCVPCREHILFKPAVRKEEYYIKLNK